MAFASCATLWTSQTLTQSVKWKGSWKFMVCWLWDPANHEPSWTTIWLVHSHQPTSSKLTCLQSHFVAGTFSISLFLLRSASTLMVAYRNNNVYITLPFKSLRGHPLPSVLLLHHSHHLLPWAYSICLYIQLRNTFPLIHVLCLFPSFGACLPASPHLERGYPLCRSLLWGLLYL